MPVEEGEAVLDLGCGSGYAARALRDAKNASRAYGIDGAPEMVGNARSYTDDPRVSFVLGDFGSLPFADESVDRVFSMKGELRNNNSYYSGTNPTVSRVPSST